MYEVGDVVVDLSSFFGHVMMVYDVDDLGNPIRIIHATSENDFHVADNDAAPLFLADSVWVFRPNWGLLIPNMVEGKKRQLIRIANAIANSAEYGYYRAFRLAFGDSSFNADSRERLHKYVGRKALALADEFVGAYRGRRNLAGAGQAAPDFVTTVTCSEAVILAYQLAFGEGSRYFIYKDAAHTMPRELKDWLLANSHDIRAGGGQGWVRVNTPD